MWNNYLDRRVRKLRYRLWKLAFMAKKKCPERPDKFNRLQELFCQWNAERLGISLEQSRERFIRSCSAIPNGHGGREFRLFRELSHEVFSVFYDDGDHEVFDAYKFHGHLHFLRLLAHKEPEWQVDHPIVQGVAQHDTVTILDFGCGLAQRSWSLAERFKTQGKTVRLALADIPTIRKVFLLWVGDKTGVPVTFLDCTAEIPIPDLPACHICIATEVFEHLYDPTSYLHKINDALLPGGFLVTGVADHKPEFMHVSPNLALLRKELDVLRYEEIERYRLFRKGASTARTSD